MSVRKKNPEVPSADHEEHIRLAAIVKGVHAELRQKFKLSERDAELIWKDHCANKDVLTGYADAMHKLATQHWARKNETRIDWCREVVREYFRKDGLTKVLEKEKRRQIYEEMRKQGTTEIESNSESGSVKDSDVSKVLTVKKINTISVPFEERILLLDVGSCFNPFSEFEEFDVVAIDISPAVESVQQCDFLNLLITEPLEFIEDTSASFLSHINTPILSLPGQSFHVVVFSLLLEYFPASYQRWKCCQKAHELLYFNGILIIITPDSHQQHRNAPLMKNWRTAIEAIGFKRCRYEKLEHLHCMVFRKIQTVAEHDSVDYADMIKIPQDFRDYDESHSNAGSSSCTTEEELGSREALLQELPLQESDSDDVT